MQSELRLLIVSHTPHYRDGGVVKGWGATIREIDHLARLFREVVHVAPLHPGPSPDGLLPYRSSRVRLRPVRPAGGEGWRAKLGVPTVWPSYAGAILSEMRSADVVHVRCPANISLLAVLLLSLVRHPRTRWVKYAGNWSPQGREALSYTLQRWWLRRNLHRGLVTVNGEWPGQPGHVRSFYNPCLTEEELEEGRKAAQGKKLTHPPRLLFVGRLESAKGVGRLLRVLALLHERGCNATVDLVGDGPERPAFEALARDLGLRGYVRFHGWVPRTGLAPHYAAAHFLVFPSSSEGWPKVLSEAMAYGVVPIASAVGSIPHYLAECSVGRGVFPDDMCGFADAIGGYLSHPDQWDAESVRGVQAATRFGYESYLHAVAGLLGLGTESLSRGGSAAVGVVR